MWLNEWWWLNTCEAQIHCSDLPSTLDGQQSSINHPNQQKSKHTTTLYCCFVGCGVGWYWTAGQTCHSSCIQSETPAIVLPNVWRALETFALFPDVFALIAPMLSSNKHCRNLNFICPLCQSHSIALQDGRTWPSRPGCLAVHCSGPVLWSLISLVIHWWLVVWSQCSNTWAPHEKT